MRVTPRARHDAIGDARDGALEVRTTAPPADGKANKAVARLLAGHFGVAPSRVELLRGARHRNKLYLVKGPVNGL